MDEFEEFPILDRAQVVELLDRLYTAESWEIARTMSEMAISNRVVGNYLAEMTMRWNNPTANPPVYKEDARQMIDTLLELYDPAKGSKQFHISLIRSTCSANYELAHWADCRDRIHKHLATIEGPAVADRLLRGLFK